MATASPSPSSNPTPAKFRIDIHDLLMSNSRGPAPAAAMGRELPEPLFPIHPERLADPGPDTPPDSCTWTPGKIYHKMRGFKGARRFED